MVILGKDHIFPDPNYYCDSDGLIALGGDLSTNRLLSAYKSGIFPWETEPVIAWYCPDPRSILIPKDIIISKSMRSILKKGIFEFKINTVFDEVIRKCKTTFRKGIEGSWISEELIESFIKLNQKGIAISAETWLNGKLVGGLYGLLIGKVFFGESMFSEHANASKFALIHLANYLEKKNIVLIDCQVHSDHLETLGAILIERKSFLKILKTLV